MRQKQQYPDAAENYWWRGDGCDPSLPLPGARQMWAYYWDPEDAPQDAFERRPAGATGPDAGGVYALEWMPAGGQVDHGILDGDGRVIGFVVVQSTLAAG